MRLYACAIETRNLPLQTHALKRCTHACNLANQLHPHTRASARKLHISDWQVKCIHKYSLRECECVSILNIMLHKQVRSVRVAALHCVQVPTVFGKYLRHIVVDDAASSET